MAFSSSHLLLLATFIIVGIISMNTPSVEAPLPWPKSPPKVKPPPKVEPPKPPPKVKPPKSPPKVKPPKPPKGPPGPIQKGFSEMFDFIKYCSLYMNVLTPESVKPNDKCCASAKKVNISVFCLSFFIPNTEKVLSPKKVAEVAKYCGNPLPLFSKCGTYIVRS